MRHHLHVLLLLRTNQRVAPVQIHALAAVQVEELAREDMECSGIIQTGEFLLGQEVGVVRGVDGLRDAEDMVGDGVAAAKARAVLDVVDSVGVSLV